MKNKFETNLMFKNIQGKIGNVVNYCLEQMTLHPNCKIYIGTDSQKIKSRKKREKGGKIAFFTVVATRYGKNGANFVYCKQNLGGMTPQEKLEVEMEITMAYVSKLEDNEILVDYIEFDYNEDEKWLSNQMIHRATGWARGIGYKTLVKPDELVAIKAANHLCQGVK